MNLPESALSSAHFQTGQNMTFSQRRPQMGGGLEVPVIFLG
jgi:hypothetical protein